MLAELERRTRDTFEDDTSTHMDYVDQWLASGQTLAALAQALADKTGFDIMRESVARYLRDAFGQDVSGRQAIARARGAHALVDATLSIADERVLTNDDNGRNRNRIAARQWAAERWNKDELAQQRGPIVAISVGSMHLDALRVRVYEQPAIATEDATVLSIEAGDDDS